MAVPLLDLSRQYRDIRTQVDERMGAVIERQTFILGDAVRDFEQALADYLHVRNAIGVASGTDALLLALRALDLRPGDEVLVPAFTFFATAGAVHNAGGTPVFVDVEPDTFNTSVEAAAAAVTKRTRAIVAVHLFGQMADMVALRALADHAGVFLLEDAAQAIGAAQRIDGSWRNPGELGDAAAFSFFPSKNLGGFGDGGMLAIGDDALAERLRRLRVHGGLKMYHHEEVGTNSRLDALQAAVLHAKLPHLDDWCARRVANARWYDRRLLPLQERGLLSLPAVRADMRPVYNQYTLRARRRDGLREALRSRGIGCAVYYPVPLHLQPCFAPLGYAAGSLPVSEALAGEVISIPVFPELTDAERDEVASAIEEYYP